MARELSATLWLKDKFSAVVDKFKKKTWDLEKYGKKIEVAMENINKKSNKALLNVGKSTLNFGKNMAIGLGVAGTAGTVFAINQAAQMEKYSGMLETAFKGNTKMAKDYFKWANKFSNETPFENAEVIDATVKLSMRGLDPKKVLGTVGDLAASMSRPLGDAVQGMLQASTGEMEIMRGFGIEKKDIQKYGIQIGAGDLIDTKGSIKDTAKFFDVMLKLVSKKTEGAMIRQAKTWGGLMSTLKGVGSSTMARFAGIQEDGTTRIGSAFDLVKKRLETYVNKLNSAVDDGTIDKWAGNFDKFATKVGTAFDNVQTYLQGITKENIDEWAKATKESLGTLVTVLEGLGTAVKFVKDNFGWLKMLGAGVAGTKAGMVAGSVVPGVGTAIGGAVGAVGGVAASQYQPFMEEMKKSEELRKKMSVPKTQQEIDAENTRLALEKFKNSTKNSVETNTITTNNKEQTKETNNNNLLEKTKEINNNTFEKTKEVNNNTLEKTKEIVNNSMIEKEKNVIEKEKNIVAEPQKVQEVKNINVAINMNGDNILREEMDVKKMMRLVTVEIQEQLGLVV